MKHLRGKSCPSSHLLQKPLTQQELPKGPVVVLEVAGFTDSQKDSNGRTDYT